VAIVFTLTLWMRLSERSLRAGSPTGSTQVAPDDLDLLVFDLQLHAGFSPPSAFLLCSAPCFGSAWVRMAGRRGEAMESRLIRLQLS
jgi:hypothetical protein